MWSRRGCPSAWPNTRREVNFVHCEKSTLGFSCAERSEAVSLRSECMASRDYVSETIFSSRNQESFAVVLHGIAWVWMTVDHETRQRMLLLL